MLLCPLKRKDVSLVYMSLYNMFCCLICIWKTGSISLSHICTFGNSQTESNYRNVMLLFYSLYDRHMGILFSNMKYPSHVKWHSDPWPTVTSQPIRLSTNFMTLIPSLTFTDFHGAFATGAACQQGTLTLPDTWFRPPFWDLLMLQLLRPNSSNLPCLYSTFHLEYPLVHSRFCFIQYKCIRDLRTETF